MRIVRSVATLHDTKLNKVGKWMLIGYTESDSYMLYNQQTEKVIFEVDALIFEEAQFLPCFVNELELTQPNPPKKPSQIESSIELI